MGIQLIDDFNENKYFDAKLYRISYGIEKIAEIINGLYGIKLELVDANFIMELYNVYDVLIDKKYLNDEELQTYKEYAPQILSLINNYFNYMSCNTLFTAIEKVSLTYKIDFIELIIKRKIYEKVPKEKASKFLELLNCHPNIYLKYKHFVDYFNDEIKEKIMNANIFAEIYINESYYDKKEKLYLPKLTADEKEETLNQYVEDKNANPHFLEKILNTRAFKNYELTQFKASENKDKAFSKILESQNGLKTTIELRCGKDLSNKIEFANQKIVLSYNAKELEKHLDYATLLNNFIYLFDFASCHTMLCNLVYKASEDGILENLDDNKGVDVYFKNYSFDIKDMISYVQVAFYLDFLFHNNININDIIRWFFTCYIREEFGINGFEISISNNPNSYFEKCKDLVTIFDEIKKQYYFWVKYNKLEKKHLDLHTKPMGFDSIPSKNNEHYYYNKSINIDKEIKMLFDDQSHLFYIEKFKSKYNSLYALLLNEKVSLDDFYDYQKESIEYLIQHDTLKYICGIVKLNIIKVLLLKMLYEDGVIVLTKIKKEKIIEILQNDDYTIDNTLLTKQESEYFDYFLNDRYTNGMHIRNKYIHLPTSKDEKICKQDYYIIIRLIIILIIKINDDLCSYNDKYNKAL